MKVCLDFTLFSCRRSTSSNRESKHRESFMMQTILVSRTYFSSCCRSPIPICDSFHFVSFFSPPQKATIKNITTLNIVISLQQRSYIDVTKSDLSRVRTRPLGRAKPRNHTARAVRRGSESKQSTPGSSLPAAALRRAHSPCHFPPRQSLLLDNTNDIPNGQQQSTGSRRPV
jgi:hypothetical protein